jgi:hypothetical protein
MVPEEPGDDTDGSIFVFCRTLQVKLGETIDLTEPVGDLVANANVAFSGWATILKAAATKPPCHALHR